MKKLLFIVAFIATTYWLAAFINNEVAPKVRLTPAQRLYTAIMHYAPMYDVPLHIAFNVARIETGYLGPFHIKYNHKQTSHCGAEGAMQIMPQYASYYAGFKVTKQQLRDSIELNVEISMKMLQDWYGRYDDWSKATGAYNTGKPILNKYAKNAVKQDYTSFWLKPDSTYIIPDTLLQASDSIHYMYFVK